MRIGFCAAVARGFLTESIDQLLEAGEVARGISVLKDELNRCAALRKRSEIAFGATDVTGQDHRKLDSRNAMQRSRVTWNCFPCGPRFLRDGVETSWFLAPEL